MQDVLGSTRTGDAKFPVGVDFGEGQSGDESPHSKIYQIHTEASFSIDSLAHFASAIACAVGILKCRLF